jgi:hypothetical protein
MRVLKFDRNVFPCPPIPGSMYLSELLDAVFGSQILARLGRMFSRTVLTEATPMGFGSKFSKRSSNLYGVKSVSHSTSSALSSKVLVSSGEKEKDASFERD